MLKFKSLLYNYMKFSWNPQCNTTPLSTFYTPDITMLLKTDKYYLEMQKTVKQLIDTSSPQIPPPRLLPHPQYRRPSSSPKRNFNGKAKFLFCHYVAARVWGTDQSVSTSFQQHDLVLQRYYSRPPKSRRFPNTAAFLSAPRLAVLRGRL